MTDKNWQIFQVDDEYHVIPTNDVQVHSYLMTCACNPHRDTDEHAVVIHSSFDGRELTEDGVKQ